MLQKVENQLYVYNVRNSEEETQKFDIPQPFLKLSFPGGAVAGVYLVMRFIRNIKSQYLIF